METYLEFDQAYVTEKYILIYSPNRLLFLKIRSSPMLPKTIKYKLNTCFNTILYLYQSQDFLKNNRKRKPNGLNYLVYCYLNNKKSWNRASSGFIILAVYQGTTSFLSPWSATLHLLAISPHGHKIVTQVSSAFQKLPLHHLTFRKDLHEYMFSLTERNPEGFCFYKKKKERSPCVLQQPL